MGDVSIGVLSVAPDAPLLQPVQTVAELALFYYGGLNWSIFENKQLTEIENFHLHHLTSEVGRQFKNAPVQYFRRLHKNKQQRVVNLVH